MGARSGFVRFSVALLLSGCSAPSIALPVTAVESAAAPTTTAAATTSPVAPAAPSEQPSTSALVNQARQDLAARLGMPWDQIVLVGMSQQEMPVGSLGCDITGAGPQLGLIIGHEIRLAADGVEYTYRSDGPRLVPCSPATFPGGRKPVFAAGTSASALRAQHLALSDLATRTGVTRSAIRVVSHQAMDWSDSSQA